MTAKIRLLTRTYDLSIEGDSVNIVEELLSLIETKGLVKWKCETMSSGIGTIEPIMKNTNNASVLSNNEASISELPSGPTGELITMISTESTTSANIGKLQSPISRVTKRDNDIFVLTPKFPLGPEGERKDAAAVVLLAAYDQVGEFPITGSRLLKSLRQTGYSLERVDTSLEALVKAGYILTEGIRKGRKYRLSESGRSYARKLAEELSALAGSPSSQGGIQ